MNMYDARFERVVQEMYIGVCVCVCVCIYIYLFIKPSRNFLDLCREPADYIISP